VTFNEILSQTIAMLHQHGRVSYRALKRQFALADDVLVDLTYELTEAQQLAVDQDGTVLVLTGEARVAAASLSARLVKIFELAFLLEVTPLPSPTLRLVCRSTLIHTQRS
jgi:hypothetical protein